MLLVFPVLEHMLQAAPQAAAAALQPVLLRLLGLLFGGKVRLAVCVWGWGVGAWGCGASDCMCRVWAGSAGSACRPACSSPPPPSARPCRRQQAGGGNAPTSNGNLPA